MLNFAPEDAVYSVVSLNPSLRYFSSDIDLDRLRHSRGQSFQSSILEVPLRDACLDLLFCFHVLEHLRDDTQAIAEVHRVLKPGGIAYIMVPINPALRESIFFGKPNPDVFDHYWAYARDFKQKLDAFDCTEIKPSGYLSPEEAVHFGVIESEIVYKCVKRREESVA